MDSTERVRRTILGQPTDRQPIYGWVSANLTNELNAAYGSVAAFEDKYEFDMSHIFPLVSRLGLLFLLSAESCGGLCFAHREFGSSLGLSRKFA